VLHYKNGGGGTHLVRDVIGRRGLWADGALVARVAQAVRRRQLRRGPEARVLKGRHRVRNAHEAEVQGAALGQPPRAA